MCQLQNIGKQYCFALFVDLGEFLFVNLKEHHSGKKQLELITCHIQ